MGRGDTQRPEQMKLTVVISHFRKDLKFVSDVEKEMEALVEAVNKVGVKTSTSSKASLIKDQVPETLLV